jgi:hypothetical protein
MSNIHLSGDVVTKKAPKKDESYVNINAGPYVAVVKQNSDPERMGRIKVLVPALSKTNDPKVSDLITCQYLTPFYGVKSLNATDKSDPYDYASSQHSYGMWATPPDIDTRVLVIFAEGKIDQAFWIGCIQDAYTNHMIPGIASSEQTRTKDVKGHHSAGLSKETVYGTTSVPAGEVNKRAWDLNGGDYNKISKPIHPLAETLRKQGLIQDTVRGTTTSSARRESPSTVFGISTPGPLDRSPGAKKYKLGARDAVQDQVVNRLPGHTFVMDDGDLQQENQHIRLRTSTGHQILLHDTEGVVYIGNASGESWVQLASNGAIDIYAGGGVNVRSTNNINFHSDANINMFAKGQIKMKAKDKVVVDGRDIQQIADNDIKLHAVGGSLTTKAPAGAILSYSGTGQEHHSGGQVHLAGTQVHHNTITPNAEVVKNLVRTDLLSEDPVGTNTLVTPIGDVNSANKVRPKPLQWQDEINETMDGMRVPTHEPYEYHYGKTTGIDMYSGSGSTNENVNAKSKVVNSAENIQQNNRASSNENIKADQLKADLEEKIKSLNLDKSIDIEKIQSAAEDFAKDYVKVFDLANAKPEAPGPWNNFGKDIKPVGPFDINKIKSLANETSSMFKQSVDSLISGDATNLLKDKVFANKDGILQVTGDLSKMVQTHNPHLDGNLSAITKGAKTIGNILGDSIVKNAETTVSPHLEMPNVKETITVDVNKIKSVHKHVVGNKVVAVTEVSKIKDKLGKQLASVSKNIGQIFGFDKDMFSNLSSDLTSSMSGSSDYDIDRLYSDEMYASFGGKAEFEKAQAEALEKAQAGEWGWNKNKKKGNIPVDWSYKNVKKDYE